MSERIRILLESIGAVCLIAAAALLHPVAGLMVAGVVLVIAANFTGGNHAGPE